MANARQPSLIASVPLSCVVGSRFPLMAINDRFLAPCPFCNSRTPSLWIDNHRNRFECTQCRAHGDHVNFIMRVDSLSAIGARDAILASVFPPSVPTLDESALGPEMSILWAGSVYKSASRGVCRTAGYRFVNLRSGLASVGRASGPPFVGASLRHRDRGLAIHPCIIAPVRQADGRFRGLLRIYLQEQLGRVQRLPLDPLPLGELPGNAIHLGQVTSHLLLCADVEDALALFAITESWGHSRPRIYRYWPEYPGRLGVWASGTIENLPSVILPRGVRRLTIASTNDDAGSTAAAEAADAYWWQSVSVDVIYPPASYRSFADAIAAERA